MSKVCSEHMNYWQLSLTYESRGGSSLPTSDFRLPTSVAMKGGGRPARYAKMLLVPNTFFFPSAA